MQINSFEQLRDIYKNDTRHSYLRIRALTPGETIYGFALVTDDDAYGAGTIANTEERLAEFFARNPFDGFFGRWVQRPLFRWTTDEWPSIGGQDDIPLPPDPPPEASQFADPVEFSRAISEFAGHWMAQSGNAFGKFRAKSLRAMVEALRDLDREGLFGTGPERDKITLFVTITDSDDSLFLDMQSARLANPRRAARRLTHALPLPFRWFLGIINFWRRLRRGPLIATSL